MFLRATLPLRSIKGGYLSNEEIIAALRKLGMELQRSAHSTGSPPDEVEVEEGGSKITIKAHTPPYYKRLAKMNLSAEVPRTAREELSASCIYLGALASHKSYVGFSRTVESELTLIVVHEKLDDIVESAEEVLKRIKKLPGVKIFDSKLFGGRSTAELFSGQAGKLLTKAKLVDDKLIAFGKERTIELIVFALSLAAAAACFALDLTPFRAGVDPLAPALRQFVAKAWPSLAVSSAVLLVTLAINYFRLTQKRLRWKWA